MFEWIAKFFLIVTLCNKGNYCPNPRPCAASESQGPNFFGILGPVRWVDREAGPIVWNAVRAARVSTHCCIPQARPELMP